MSGLYANKFTVEKNDVVRIVFVDERAPIRQGMPMPASTAAEIVLTIENARHLGELLTRIAKKEQS